MHARAWVCLSESLNKRPKIRQVKFPPQKKFGLLEVLLGTVISFLGFDFQGGGESLIWIKMGWIQVQDSNG